MQRVSLETKHQAEITKYVFDFASQLAVGETIILTGFTVIVYSGTDANPSSIISGSPAISGTKVTQAIIGGIPGVTYLCIMQVVTSVSQQLTLTGYLVIIPTTA